MSHFEWKKPLEKLLSLSAERKKALPMVSVIITCFNHGHYLSEAIESILAQDWGPDSSLNQIDHPFEIIVVDDGSTDNTRQVAERFPQVRYIYQKNQGLSAARNKGIAKSRGSFLVFLDADDWFFTNALGAGVYFLERHPEIAFVSGGHYKVDSGKNYLPTENIHVVDNHYLRFLEGNYVGMHAAVMYRKEILKKYLFDPTLKAGEDYDLYLRIARNHSVFHHTTPVATYRIHNANMSGDRSMMLSTVLQVLARQESHLRTDEEQAAYRRGREAWTGYYRGLMEQEK